MKSLHISNISLVNYEDLSNSLLIQAVKEFYNFPDNFHDFQVINDNEYYLEISFKNYQNTLCSVIYHRICDEIRLKKGSGGVNFNYLKLINNLIKLGVYTTKKIK